MKKIAAALLTFAVTVACTACNNAQEEAINMEPTIFQMRSICELAVMECYYHNVAKYTEENAETFLWWSKDKHFWIEYSGTVKFGVDISLVNMEVDDSVITITLPEAEVQSCKVDSSSLTKDSYIVDKNSAAIDAQDEIQAFEEAQIKLEETASNDRALLAEAQQRAQTLLEDYINNIGSAVGKEYTIKWIYTDTSGNRIVNTSNDISYTDYTDENNLS